MVERAKKRRSNYAPLVLGIQVSQRTRKQWDECKAIGKLIGWKKSDLLMATALRRLKDELRLKCKRAGIDYKAALEAMERTEKTASLEVRIPDRAPFVDE